MCLFSFRDPGSYKIIAFDDNISETHGIQYEIKNITYTPNFFKLGLESYDEYDLAIVEVKQLFKYALFLFVGDQLTINSPEASSLYVVAHGQIVSIVT